MITRSPVPTTAGRIAFFRLFNEGRTTALTETKEARMITDVSCMAMEASAQ